MSCMMVHKAIIPAAGLGTRVRSIAGELPKELLAVGGEPRGILERKSISGKEAGLRRVRGRECGKQGMRTKILLADDHKIMLDGLRSLLEVRSDMEVVAEAENGREAVRLAQELRPEVVIMDINMPDLNGMEATRRIVAALPRVKIIALSMYSDRRYVAGMFKAGASGFLLKACAFEELAKAIEAVIANQVYLSSGIAGVLVEDYVQRLPAAASSSSAELTSREREVLQLLAEGRSAREIASHLCVSVKTVHTHRQQIMDKLNLHSIAELTKYAIREGMTSPDL